MEGCLVDILNEKGFQCTDKIRNYIERTLLEKFNYTCTLGFRGSVRKWKRHISAYARCRSTEHVQNFRFILDDLTGPVCKLCIYSDVETIKSTHPNTKTFKQLRGQERVEIKQLLRQESATDIWTDIQSNTKPEIVRDGHMQDLKSLNVIFKAATEDVERLQL